MTALAFAARLLKERKNRPSFREPCPCPRAFRFCGRTVGLHRTLEAGHRNGERKGTRAQDLFSKIKRTVMAEKTGEPYDFGNFCPCSNLLPDLQGSEVDARTRGLAHVCLVIFNLNEFSYLD